MNRGPAGRLTVGELVERGPLPGTVVHGPVAGGAEVRAVRIVERMEALDRLAPHTAVVLVGEVSASGWMVEMALRKAWEQAAACVVAGPATERGDSVGELAERLGVPLLVVPGDALDAAVRIATAVARPEAGRTALLARTARALAEAGTGSATRLLGVLHEALPAVSIALVDPLGSVLAGRSGALAGGPGAEAVRVALPGPDGRLLGDLVARPGTGAAHGADTVHEVLDLAVAPLTAWAAVHRLADERAGHRARVLLGRLTAPTAESGAPGPEDTDPVRAEAAALGWPLHGPFTVCVLRPLGEAGTGDGAALRALWARHGAGGPLVERDGRWATWHSAAVPETRLRTALSELSRYLPVAAGTAGAVDGLADLPVAFDRAAAAAEVASAGGVPAALVRADGLGAAQLLAAVPGQVLRGPAELVMAPLLAADRDGVLLRTLAAVLDAGTAPTAAAAALGVHRNTVTARLERIRALGFDPDDPEQRLALHLACRVLLTRAQAGGTPPA
ncbi:helix-turn-helix domain-containing protein [Kitasatospora phosalacinea]|uniref:helix-turn-helix domain-containing protein n=1 Tax=Kitasatospora phosalacinea TaxID=2065 RepID=UPI003666B5C2